MLWGRGGGEGGGEPLTPSSNCGDYGVEGGTVGRHQQREISESSLGLSTVRIILNCGFETITPELLERRENAKTELFTLHIIGKGRRKSRRNEHVLSAS